MKSCWIPEKRKLDWKEDNCFEKKKNLFLSKGYELFSILSKTNNAWWMSSLLSKILKLYSKNIILVYDLISNSKMFMNYAFTTKTSQRHNQQQEKTKNNGDGRVDIH